MLGSVRILFSCEDFCAMHDLNIPRGRPLTRLS